VLEDEARPDGAEAADGGWGCARRFCSSPLRRCMAAAFDEADGVLEEDVALPCCCCVCKFRRMGEATEEETEAEAEAAGRRLTGVAVAVTSLVDIALTQTGWNNNKGA